MGQLTIDRAMASFACMTRVHDRGGQSNLLRPCIADLKRNEFVAFDGLELPIHSGVLVHIESKYLAQFYKFQTSPSGDDFPSLK